MKYDNIEWFKDERGYYFSGTFSQSLHRYIWEKNNGPIKKGYIIHHKDENKENNNIDNLECLTRSEHQRKHMMGQKFSEERRKNIVKNRIGRKHRLPVKCKETGEIFSCMKEAAIKYNTHISLISKCCKGEAAYTKGNFHWEFIN